MPWFSTNLWNAYCYLLMQVVQVPVGTVVHLVSGSVPSLEQPSVTPDTTISKVENDGVGDRIDDAISASWLDSLCLDKRKGEQSGLLVNEREGFYQVENPGDEHSIMEIGSAGGKVLGLVSRTGIVQGDEGRTFGEEDSSGDYFLPPVIADLSSYGEGRRGTHLVIKPKLKFL